MLLSAFAVAIGNRRHKAAALHNLGRMAQQHGDYEGASAHFTESLRLFLALENRVDGIVVLGSMACLAAAQGHAEYAACIFGATEALREAMQVPSWKGMLYRDSYDHHRSSAQAKLGEDAWAAAWAAGAAMTLEQALAAALGPSAVSHLND